jgi:hypothetical protein
MLASGRTRHIAAALGALASALALGCLHGPHPAG